MTDYRNEFIKEFNSLRPFFSPWNLWCDFTSVFANAIRLPFYYKEASEVIKQVSEKYGDKFKVLDRMSSLVTDALEHKIQDFLGSVFMELDLGNKFNGQFFTPYHVAQLLAKFNNIIDHPQIKKSFGLVKASDCCIGGGALMLALMDELKFAKINFQEHIFFEGVDVDINCCNMAYIQMSLIGAAGEIVHGNSLTLKFQQHWFTPMYFLKNFPEKFKAKKMCESVLNLLKTPVVKTAKKIISPPIVKTCDADINGQLFFEF